MLTTRPLRRTPVMARPAASDPLDTSAALRNGYLSQSRPSALTPRLLSSDMPNILHVGCGSRSPGRLHDFFRLSQWNEVRCDIDPENQPDILASITNLRGSVADATYDAIWASHIMEHLARHEVPLALAEFVRALTPAGFALMRSPDIEAVAQFIVDGRLNDVIYVSPAGPITPLDMMYGHGASIAQRKSAMRHGTAFTQELLASDLLEAGFDEVRTARTRTYEVWAVAFMPEADASNIVEGLVQTGIDFRD